MKINDRTLNNFTKSLYSLKVNCICMPSMWWYKKTGENVIKVTKIYLFIVLSNIHLKLEFKIVIKIQFCSYFSVFVRHWFLISKNDSVSNLIPISRSIFLRRHNLDNSPTRHWLVSPSKWLCTADLQTSAVFCLLQEVD